MDQEDSKQEGDHAHDVMYMRPITRRCRGPCFNTRAPIATARVTDIPSLAREAARLILGAATHVTQVATNTRAVTNGWATRHSFTVAVTSLRLVTAAANTADVQHQGRISTESVTSYPRFAVGNGSTIAYSRIRGIRSAADTTLVDLF